LSLASSECLGLTRALSYLPSPAIGLTLAERAKKDPPRPAASLANAMLLVGAPEHVELDATAKDLEDIGTAYPRGGRRFLFGSDASLESLKTALPTARVAQLFT